MTSCPLHGIKLDTWNEHYSSAFSYSEISYAGTSITPTVFLTAGQIGIPQLCQTANMLKIYAKQLK